MNVTPNHSHASQPGRYRAVSDSPMFLGRKSQLTRSVTRLSDITWDLVVARRREARLRNQFLKTVLRLAENDRR